MTKRKRDLLLVAGGAGFLGSHLCESLVAEGAHVVCVDNLLTGRRQNLRGLEREPGFDFCNADIVNQLPQRLRAPRAKFDAIFNLACAASPPHYQADPEHTLLTSVVGTHRLLKLAEDMRARFLLASTSEVYGDPDVHPQAESYWGNVNPTGPRACYDEGKRAAETLTFDFERAGRADVRVVRIFNTYGPRMRADDGRVVSNVITQALADDDITVYGDGQQTRSFCYVNDLIDGLMRMMRHVEPLPGPINLGNPAELTVAELVRRVVALTGSRSAIVRRPLPIDDPRRRRPDITRAERHLGWSPRVSLQAGLEASIRWFARQGDRGLKPAQTAAALKGAVPA